MTKKYLPYIVLLAAALLLWYIRNNQRGSYPRTPADSEAITINTPPELDRNTQHIQYSRHARCRMECRQIDESEVRDIIERGAINYNKIEVDERGKTIPLEGVTHDQQTVRIVVAPAEGKLVVVTVIDLKKDWPCDCD